MVRQLIKQRKANMSERGIYVQDKELLQSLFQVGTYFYFECHEDEKKVIVLPSNEKMNNTVSKRKMKDFIKPVIDIRVKSVLAVFEGCAELEVSIYDNQIVIQGLDPEVEEEVEVEVTEEEIVEEVEVIQVDIVSDEAIVEEETECHECRGAGTLFNEWFEVEICNCQN